MDSSDSCGGGEWSVNRVCPPFHQQEVVRLGIDVGRGCSLAYCRHHTLASEVDHHLPLRNALAFPRGAFADGDAGSAVGINQ